MDIGAKAKKSDKSGVKYFLSKIKMAGDDKFKKFAAQEALKNKENQMATEKLVKDLQDVAIGNLAKQITTDNFLMKPITNSINQTVESLRSIVSNIKTTTNSVMIASEQASNNASSLIESAHQQFQKIQESIKTIGKITSDIDDIAKISWVAKQEAEKSSKASRLGEEVVSESMNKMTIIRETIQDSSKKIKRLGESSQAIGEVTGLIRDITKKINLLALNAAIQAATTGEAGRAFSVVAQEVQRLAQDSGDAAKKIDELILHIQEDAKVAVAAMEKTTQEVVDGSRLTDAAGQSLKEIDAQSEQLAVLISEITAKVEEKSSEMTSLAIGVKELQDINANSIRNVKDTTLKIEEIKNSAGDLGKSVSNFKV